MKDLLLKVVKDGEWKPLRFTIYNYLEEKEYYQLHLTQNGYDNSFDDLECKTFETNNLTALKFKNYVERTLQNGYPIVTVCVMEGSNYFTIVKPKCVDILLALKLD